MNGAQMFCRYDGLIHIIGAILLMAMCVQPVWAQNEKQNADELVHVNMYQNSEKNADQSAMNQVVSIDADNASLLAILEELADQAGLSLSYIRQNIPLDIRKSLALDQVALEEALFEILEGTNLRFAISRNRNLVLFKGLGTEYVRKKQQLQEVVQGTISDATTGQPLPGVNVVIKGTTIGTSTDLNGDFELTVTSLQDTLVLSYIGYKKKELPMNGNQEFKVQLVPEIMTGDEVVVVGFGEQKRSSVTGSINSVQGEKIARVPAASIGNSLTGQTRGLQIIQSIGEPGRDDPQIFLRGVSSLSEERSQPLFVLDGVVVRDARTITRLDPNNVESVSVLKDASATAVYGVEGANGVIVVETKQGRSGPLNISVNTSAGLQSPVHKQEFADSYTYARAFNEAQINDGLSPDRVRFKEEAMEAFRTGSDPLIYPDVDWVDYLTRSAILQNRTNVSVSGGTEDVRFYVAGGFQNQEGLMRTFDSDYDFNPSYERYNIRSNLNMDLTPSTRIGLKAAGRIESWVHANRFQWRNQYLTPPFAGAGIIDGRVISSSDRYISGPKRYNMDFYGSGFNENNRSSINLNLTGTQDLGVITKGLEVQLKGSYNAYFTRTKTRDASLPNFEPYYRTDVDPTATGDSTVVFRRIGEEELLGYDESFGKDRDWYLEARLQYDRDFGPHGVEGLLLFGQRKRYYPSQFPGIPRGLVNTVSRVNYNYDDRYLLELSMGYNGSENFAEGNRFGFFPAISGGWIITNEPYIPEVPYLSYLKLRASYGMVGNDTGIGRFLYLPSEYIASTPGYNFGHEVPQNQVGAREGQIGNPGITWETSFKQNYGVEMRLFNDRLDMEFDYYYEFRDGILTTRNTIPSYVAASNLPPGNIGEVKSWGYEAEIEWRQQLGEFFFSISGNVTHSLNEIVHIDEPIPNEPYQSRIGEPVGQEFGWVFDGFYTEEDIENIGDGVPEPNWDVKPGYLKYKDLNGDGVVNEDDVRPIGHPQDIPEYSFGSTLNFNYKNVDLSMVWAAATNVSEMLDQAPNRVPFGHDGARSMREWQWEGRWQPDKDPDEILFPRLSIAEAQQRVDHPSDFWLIDASYIRLKSVELGYSFGSRIVEALGMQKLRIYANAYNPLTFSHMMDTYSIDPEQGGHRVEADYPVMKVYNFGIELDL